MRQPIPFLAKLPNLALFCFFYLITIFPQFCHSISIDNDIIGEPDIECLDQEIRVWIKTRKYFQGRIYAKGKADDPECAKDDFSGKRTRKVHFDLGLGRCGMKSLRSFDPRGMYYGITLVISFHPMFITKVDQAFHVKCFFEEANRGLTAELGVSMIPTTEVEARHGIPGCSYSIHKSSIDELDAGKAAGIAIQFAKVGDKVLHQWHCDDQMFGILINNCFVTDGVKQKVQVIDTKGCPLDPILITGIRYSADLQRAYAESQVFKFADRPGVWFFCQIQMCMKKDGMCDGVTPPSCSTTSTTISQQKNKNKGKTKILPGGRKKGGGEGGEGDYGGGGDEGDEVAESDGQTPPNSSNEQDNGAARKGPSPGYDEKGSTTGDYEGGGTNEYAELAAKTKPEYTTTAKPQPLAPAINKKGKSRENQSPAGPYSAPAVPIGYDQSGEEEEAEEGETTANGETEAVTPFGPGYAANQVGDGPFGVGRDPPGGIQQPPNQNAYIPPNGRTNEAAAAQRRQEYLSTEFETEDDLRRSPSTTNTPLVRPTSTTTIFSTLRTEEGRRNGLKKDYVDDYEGGDVTIPPHLTDLLANLQPEEINAQNLQKMFRDSVADRRTLLQGFDLMIRKMKEEEEQKSGRRKGKRRKESEIGGMPGQKIDTVKVSWESPNRMARDSPIIGKFENNERRTFGQSNSPNDPPVIAGQLLIYDLDETPPSIPQHLADDCILNRNGLAILGIGSGALVLMLILMGIGLLLRLRKAKMEEWNGQKNGGKGNCQLAAELSQTPSMISFGSAKCILERKRPREEEEEEERINRRRTNRK